MSGGTDWLYERLKSELVTDNESGRWNSIVSRLRSLTRRDDSPSPCSQDEHDQPRIGASPERGYRTGDETPEVAASGARPGRTMADREVMKLGETHLVSLAAALMGENAELSIGEGKLVARAQQVDARLVGHARAQILAGTDVLGTAFCSLRSADERRETGSTYTPAPIVEAMAAWAQAEIPEPARIVDPGAGSGRFLVAAARKFPNAELIAVEIDPLATLMLRANAAVYGFADRLRVHVVDYRRFTLPAIARPTLFIGNPPYVRHHDIQEQWKTWFADTATRYGLAASKLAGLHIHFFLKTRELARPGDYGAFITAAEWLDVNYGSVLRRMLCDGLGGTGLHIIDPRARPFADALSTGAITCFRLGSRPAGIAMRSVSSLGELAALRDGGLVTWGQLAGASKWSIFLREQKQAPAGSIELGELFHVHRGQVTGNNGVWIDNAAARDVPKRFKPISITSARQLFAAGAELMSTRGLHRVIDFPADLDTLDTDERKAVQRFLRWATAQGAHESYIARHRRAWWSVGLRVPAPILCTYMARRPPAFVRNRVRARHINIAHGLYPREPLSDAALSTVVAYLRCHMTTAGGRTYAGGLVKFEPRELERILLPRLEDMHGYLAKSETTTEAVDGIRAGVRCSSGEDCVP